VNRVTPQLFARYPDAASLAVAEPADVEALIRPTGFFRAKARNLIAVARRIADDHAGAVPPDPDRLTTLPGVGRKTANVVLGNAFGIAGGVVVDTHVKRMAFRLGWTRSTDPVVIERDLMSMFPDREWIDLSHRLILHGRSVCRARRPLCGSCGLAELCPRIGVVERNAPGPARLRGGRDEASGGPLG
jgi:endonuclease-3